MVCIKKIFFAQKRYYFFPERRAIDITMDKSRLSFQGKNMEFQLRMIRCHIRPTQSADFLNYKNNINDNDSDVNNNENNNNHNNNDINNNRGICFKHITYFPFHLIHVSN